MGSTSHYSSATAVVWGVAGNAACRKARDRGVKTDDGDSVWPSQVLMGSVVLPAPVLAQAAKADGHRSGG